MSETKQKDIGKLVDKTKRPKTVSIYSGITKLNEYVFYAIYDLKGELTYKAISEEEYNKIDINV